MAAFRHSECGLLGVLVHGLTVVVPTVALPTGVTGVQYGWFNSATSGCLQRMGRDVVQ